MEDKKPLTQQPFAGLVHSAFVPSIEAPPQSGLNQREKNQGRRRPQHNNNNRMEAQKNMERHGQQASELGRAAGGEGEESVQEKRNRAKDVVRDPVTGLDSVSFGQMMNTLGTLAQQNGETLRALTNIFTQNMERQTLLLGQLGEIGQKIGGHGGTQAELITFLGREAQKAKKGKKSLFGKTKWDKLEEGGYRAGSVAIGVALGYGVVKVAEAGIKAAFRA